MAEVHLVKNLFLGTLIGHETGALHNTIIVFLRMAMLLALWRTVLHQLLSIQLAPVHLHAGKGPTGTSMQTDRLMTSSRGQAFTIRLIRPK